MTDVKPCPFCGSSEFEIRERVMEDKKGYPVTLLHWCYHDRGSRKQTYRACRQYT
jgi:hypothetical protein